MLKWRRLILNFCNICTVCYCFRTLDCAYNAFIAVRNRSKKIQIVKIIADECQKDYGNNKVESFTIRDITKRKESEKQIKTLLSEREMLIKEVYHRVKNNFAVVSSLLSLQAQYII